MVHKVKKYVLHNFNNILRIVIYVIKGIIFFMPTTSFRVGIINDDFISESKYVIIKNDLLIIEVCKMQSLKTGCNDFAN